MKHLMARAGALAAVVLCLAIASHAQYDSPASEPAPQAAPQAQTPAPKGPVVSKQELQAYNKLVADQAGNDVPKITAEAEGFLAKYPKSVYAASIYGQLANLYFAQGQTDKMTAAANTAIQLNPDNVDVLPLLAMVTARTAKSTAPDFKDQLQKAEDYGKHGVETLTAMAKPDKMDDATFTKTKNDRLAMCHSALGLVNVDRGKNDVAIAELTQAVQLSSTPDSVDYFLLGRADVTTSHFTGAIDAFTKCSTTGPMQAACKAGVDDAKKKKETGLEAPQ